MKDIVIVSAARTAVGKFGCSLTKQNGITREMQDALALASQ